MKNKDVSIQMVRIIAMFSIILCHLVQELNNTDIAKMGQFFNVGVYIFLLLSGWLYGGKEIRDTREWLFERAKRVLLPMWIFMIFLFGIYCFQGTMKWVYIPIYLTNTQYWIGQVEGGAHLWFISVIFLCYLMVPLLQKIKNNLIIIILGMVISGYILCYLNHTMGMTILYASIFAIGYWIKIQNVKVEWQFTIVFIGLALIIRLISRKILDGTVLYDCLLVYVTHTVLAIGLFFFERQILRIKSNKIINWLDDMSYFIYITHYMFMVGPIRTMGLTDSLLTNIAITIVASFSIAIALQMIYTRIVQKSQ